MPELWPCAFCNREHPAHPATFNSQQPSAYCPELGARVYTPSALLDHNRGCRNDQA